MTRARELSQESTVSPAAPAGPTRAHQTQSAPTPDSDKPPARPKVTRSSIRRLRTINRVYLVLLTLLLIAVIILTVLFNQVRNAAIGWEEEARAMNVASQELGEELGEIRDRLIDTEFELGRTEEQLESAHGLIDDLNSALNNTDDRNQLLTQIQGQQQSITFKAQESTEAYENCFGGLSRLLDYRTNIELYDEEAVDEYEERVNGICEYASEAHSELSDMIDELSTL